MERRTKVLVGVGLVGGGALLVGTRRGRAAARAVLDELDELDQATETEHLAGEERWLVSHDEADLFVTVAGPDDGPVVVLAHCWTGSRQVWAPVARRLVAAGCRVVRWDQRGHGQSRAGHKGHSIEGLADDLATVVTELDLHDVVLAGHSMGGMTVQAFATHHHELFHGRTRAVVLVATSAHSLNSPIHRQAKALVRSATVERLFERPAAGRVMVRTTFGRAAHRHHVETTLADFLATPPVVRSDFAAAMAAMDLRDGIAKIDVPTTILVGSRDTLTPPPLSRSLAAAIPGAELEVLAGYGHMLPYEAPDTVTDAILAHVAAR